MKNALGNSLGIDQMLMINLGMQVTQNCNDDLALAKITLGRPENFIKMTEITENRPCY